MSKGSSKDEGGGSEKDPNDRQDDRGQRQGPCEYRGNTESCGQKMGKSGGTNAGGNRPYQSPPPPQPPPAVPGPYSSRLQNGGATADGVALTLAVTRLKKLL